DALAQLDGIEADEQLNEQLSFSYPYAEATKLAAKTSITEMKRIQAAFEEEDADYMFGDFYSSAMHEQEQRQGNGQAEEEERSYTLHLLRPSFMEQKKLSATEKGSVNHLLMQHIPLHV